MNKQAVNEIETKKNEMHRGKKVGEKKSPKTTFVFINPADAPNQRQLVWHSKVHCVQVLQCIETNKQTNKVHEIQVILIWSARQI